jgi:hypothetical protein
MTSNALIIGREKQLFIDDYAIEELAGVRRTFHQARKHPSNPLLLQRDWWEDYYIQLYGNVLFDPQQQEFRMYYNAISKADIDSVCMAISKDGVKWERPTLNVVHHNGRPMSNAVLKGALRLPTVLHAADEPDPQRRYRMIVYTSKDLADFKNDVRSNFRHGYSVFFSPDGIHWKPNDRNPVIQGSDMCTCCYDPVTKEYIAFVKYGSTIGGKFRRSVAIHTSRDFVNWGVSQTILSADEIDDARVAERLYRFRDLLKYDEPASYLSDIYGMTGFRYEGLRLGIIWLFDISATRTGHGNGNDGIMNAQLVYSRDANPYGYWNRTSERRDFIPCGNQGDFDAGMVFTSSTVIEVGDEIWFYYTGSDESYDLSWEQYEKANRAKPQSKVPTGTRYSIGLATLRRDGFASLYANYPAGKMTTKLLTFAGERLEINADSEKGSILVETLDEQGKPIAGFTKEECATFSKDAICGVVEWKSGKSIRELAGKPIRLVFHIETAKLYAFQFV